MRILKFLLIKEFKQIFRNRTILTVMMIMPIIQLIILPLAANFEIKNINLAVVDGDRSDCSRDLIAKVVASGYFRLSSYDDSYQQAFIEVEEDRADVILQIPQGFERGLMREYQQQVFIGVNAINGTKAGLGSAYLSDIIRVYNTVELRNKIGVSDRFNAIPIIEITTSNWYNPLLNYSLFMVPGILAILVTMVGGFLSALNIVKEKEAGTTEQINVSPIKKHHFILGKLIPFWILGNVVFGLGLTAAWIFYSIIPLGSLWVLYAFVSVYLLAILGFGLLISTLCETQQQAMLIMFFFVMIFVLMGGLFTPIDSMPDWAKAVSKCNPISYFIEVMRMVIVKGSGFGDIGRHIIIIIGFAIVLNVAAVLNYRKIS